MARILVNTSVSQAFWDAVQEFGSTTKYIKEHDRLKAAAYVGITLTRLLDEYEKQKASNGKSEISLELLIAMLRQIRSGILNWE